MKKIILVALLIPIFGFSQLIGEIRPAGKLHLSVEKVNNSYLITYIDTKFQYIDSYKDFTLTSAEFMKLKQILKEQMAKKKPDKSVKMFFNNDKEILDLKFLKIMGLSFNFNCTHANANVVGSSVALTKGKIKRLFFSE